MWSWVKSLFKKQKTQVHKNRTWEWDNQLKEILIKHINDLSLAIDVKQLHQKYYDLKTTEQVDVWCEFFKWLAFYESGWDPNSACVDVGTDSDHNTWSIGLLQMSVCDQKNMALPLNYKYETLLLPVPNLELGVAVMVYQIKKRKKIFIPKGESGVYWATLHPGGKYDKTLKILGHIHAAYK